MITNSTILTEIFLYLSLAFLLACVGCGEIRHYKALVPIASDQWNISDGTYQNETISVAEQSSNIHNIKVRVVPLVDTQSAVGPIIPIIPNNVDSGSGEQVVLVIISIEPSPPKGKESINGIKINIKNSNISPSNIETFTLENSVSYRISFFYPMLNNGSLELILPDFGFKHESTTLKYELRDETNYRIVPPKGMFQ